ncbi:Uncharacterised protein [Salmonella enterica subsp. enterica]|uniref:Uncharacterized protein n=1 Tax=Salmonella enterica I TaxID=59201 RepID=A0A379Y2K5_SALET|nr:Uncharacterised protein [Salmonella enterica subsp. enterica]
MSADEIENISNRPGGIDKSLAEIGIVSLRIYGKDIVADPLACATIVRDRLSEL